jgi:DNA-binding MarR family transcriptional regulator
VPKTPVLRQSDYVALAQIRYELRRFLTFSAETARAAGLEPQQHQLLLALKALTIADRPTIGTLAERLQLKHHSAVELATRCESGGLLTRDRSERDRREVTLRITPRGERLLAKLSLAHKAELQSAAPSLLRALEAVIGSTRDRGNEP